VSYISSRQQQPIFRKRADGVKIGFFLPTLTARFGLLDELPSLRREQFGEWSFVKKAPLTSDHGGNPT